MSWDADHDCPNCGLSLYDERTPSFPFCDELCERNFEQRRALRRMKVDLFLWNTRARWSLLVVRIRAARRGPAIVERTDSRPPRSHGS